jgi:hypothetical protein
MVNEESCDVEFIVTDPKKEEDIELDAKPKLNPFKFMGKRVIDFFKNYKSQDKIKFDKAFEPKWLSLMVNLGYLTGVDKAISYVSQVADSNDKLIAVNLAYTASIIGWKYLNFGVPVGEGRRVGLSTITKVIKDYYDEKIRNKEEARWPSLTKTAAYFIIAGYVGLNSFSHIKNEFHDLKKASEAVVREVTIRTNNTKKESLEEIVKKHTNLPKAKVHAQKHHKLNSYKEKRHQKLEKHHHSLKLDHDKNHIYVSKSLYDLIKKHEQGIKSINNALSRVNKYNNIIKRFAKHTNVPLDLYKALFITESGGRHTAGKGILKSKKGALGIAQIMPSTAKELGINPYQVEGNIKGGIGVFNSDLRRFNNVIGALVKYNASTYQVMKAMLDAKSSDYLDFRDYLALETKRFPIKVLAILNKIDPEVIKVISDRDYAKITKNCPAYTTALNKEKQKIDKLKSKFKIVKTYHNKVLIKYKVHKGDNPSKIVRDYNTKIKDIYNTKRIGLYSLLSSDYEKIVINHHGRTYAKIIPDQNIYFYARK